MADIRRNRFIRPMGLSVRHCSRAAGFVLPVAAGEAGAGHALAQPAFLEEILFKALELLVEQVVRLMDQADEDVGDRFRRPGFDEFAEVVVGEVVLAAEFADKERFLGVFVPLCVAVLAEVIAVMPSSSSRLPRATLVNLISDSLEVPETWLPSAMFLLPLRAACTI